MTSHNMYDYSLCARTHFTVVELPYSGRIIPIVGIFKSRLSEVREITEHWLRQYNEERPYDSLDKLTPREHLMATSNRETSKSTWH